MSFEIHSDVAEHGAFVKLSLAAFGFLGSGRVLDVRAREPGFVPGRAVVDLSDGEDIAPIVDQLVKAGVWTAVEGGYRMEFGPSSDWPMPLWRYSD
jgi:hypothetical protein